MAGNTSSQFRNVIERLPIEGYWYTSLAKVSKFQFSVVCFSPFALRQLTFLEPSADITYLQNNRQIHSQEHSMGILASEYAKCVPIEG